MLSPNGKRLEKLDPFYQPSVAKQKTSAEIVSEARKALRAVRTQRPFTPQEDQRKLFGLASSRTPENRPPSSFSLHASSFESSDSRPITGTRLSPLELKPKAPASPTTEEDPCLSFPKPPVDPTRTGRISGTRTRLRRAALPEALLPAGTLSTAERQKTVESKETVSMGDSLAKISGIYLTASEAVGHLKSPPLPLTCSGGFIGIKEQEMFPGPTPLSSHLGNGGDPGRRRARASSCPGGSDLSRLETKAVLKADLQEKDTETEAGEVFWNTRIVPILDKLEKGGSVPAVCAACTRLQHALEEGNALGTDSRRRRFLLKTLYKLVDVGSDPLSLKLAKIFLTLKVGRKNLLNVCKLIFKISRNEENDSLLQSDSILESLLEVLKSEDLQTNTEAFLYCMGTIKFLSGNPAFLNEMISKGAVEVLITLIKQIIENTKKYGTCLPNSGHLLVQMTATLRNLVESPLARSELLSTGAIPQLCVVMGQYVGDKDVCTNFARIFSKLTSYHDCCVALASYSRCYALFLNLINKYQKKQGVNGATERLSRAACGNPNCLALELGDIIPLVSSFFLRWPRPLKQMDLVVRIVFVLGNLTAKNNQAREQLFQEKGSIPTLLSLFRAFRELDLHPKRRGGEGSEQPMDAKPPPAQAQDVLVKLTRVFANLAIHADVGPALAASPQAVGLLLSTLENKSIDDCEELVVNTTAAINNFSYYQVKDSVIQAQKLRVAELLLNLLMSNNMDGILEAVRVFGNLSQDPDIRDFIVQKNVHKFMMALLDAEHQEVCFSACGVLLNLTVEKDKCATLKEGGGIKKLVDCLRDFGPTDWQLACLVCKTLWNVTENTPDAPSCFGDEDASTLFVLLSTFLDEELALDGISDQDLKNYHKLHWETEFKPVAQQLLNRIQTHHTFLGPLPSPSNMMQISSRNRKSDPLHS